VFFKKKTSLTDKVLNLETETASLCDKTLKNKTDLFVLRLLQGEALDTLLPEAFAVCREAASRVLHMKHFPVQVMGAIALHQGKIIEMKTGEGKTLVAILPAYLYALTGKKVHIVTVNEYLAKRDKEQMSQVFSFLGLKTGLIYSGQLTEEKKEAYSCHIIYGTNSEFGFDYLRDNLVKSADNTVQTGQHFAIIDEADSILIDEARLPFVISGTSENPSPFTKKTDSLVRKLSQDCYDLDEKEKKVSLNEEGVVRAEQLLKIKNLASQKHVTLRHYISVALQAHHIIKRDIDYIITNNKIVLIDQFTGRLVPGKTYREGLHQAVEVKEGLEPRPENRVIASISQQNYYRMYEKLSGMTGTAISEKEEFRLVYNLDTVEIPTNMPLIRKDYPDIVLKTKKEKWKMVVADVISRHIKGQPVLIGTTGIKKSEKLSEMLLMQNIPHRILNAKHDASEAEIISCAGQIGAVTVATNMAGRGTDIILGQNTLEHTKLLELGGLCVIGTERHESRRIDDQLRGRAGRQGDSGESLFYLSLEDDLLVHFGGEKVKSLTANFKGALSGNLLSEVIKKAQKMLEGIHFNTRKTLLQYDNIINLQRSLIYRDRKKILNADRAALLDYLKSINTSMPHPDKLPTDDILRKTILEAVDGAWINHLEGINYLKQGVRMHANPLESFKREAFLMYQEMICQINEEINSNLIL